MAFDFGSFGDEHLSEAFVEWLVDERATDVQQHFGKLWDYYQNQSRPMYGAGHDGPSSKASRIYVQAQEYGLPRRITGLTYTAEGGLFSGNADSQRKEVVIENDIAWRINAMVDFLFGKEFQIVSKAQDGGKRVEIEQLLKALFEANGAVGFFQDMAVLGGVYGFVDCLVRASDTLLDHFAFPSKSMSFDEALSVIQTISLELIEAPRALPILDEGDYKKLRYYVQHFREHKNQVSGGGSFLHRLFHKNSGLTRDAAMVTEIIGPRGWQRYENMELAAEGHMPWEFVPVVHIQNIAQPYYYEGVSDVEQLIPLQDELNTRLSDRANRITFQCFKMFLAKGLESACEREIAPGKMWITDNMNAKLETFGGDAATPSEDLHITEIREALDKASGVTPVVAGVLKNKLGNLTSAVALKIAMLGTLAKTERKRFTYGEGIKRISKMVLEMLDAAGVYATTAQERQLEIIFASPLPENTLEKLQEAKLKKELGVNTRQVLRELGYDEQE